MTDPLEIAWAAGLFEGEGCFTILRKPRRVGPDYLYAQAALNMTDEEPVRRFHAAMGVGSVIGPKAGGRPEQGWKPRWFWHSNSKENYVVVMEILLPWLSPRRRDRCIEVFTIATAAKQQHHTSTTPQGAAT